MADHLPECWLIEQPAWIIKPFCICDRLRACEQRSYTLGIEVGKHDGWVAGHAVGVQAARDAVADCRVPWPTATGDLVNEGIDDALAAIDALAKGDRA